MISHARILPRRLMMTASAIVISVAMAPAAHASGSSMPWEQPLQQILQSIEGPVAKIREAVEHLAGARLLLASARS